MEGQMTIFDFLPQPEAKSLENLPEDEMVRLMSEATGLDFKPTQAQKYLGHELYEAKRGKETYSIGYMNAFSFRKNEYVKSISCSYSYGTGGCSVAIDNLDDAIQFFKKRLSEE